MDFYRWTSLSSRLLPLFVCRSLFLWATSLKSPCEQGRYSPISMEANGIQKVKRRTIAGSSSYCSGRLGKCRVTTRLGEQWQAALLMRLNHLIFLISLTSAVLRNSTEICSDLFGTYAHTDTHPVFQNWAVRCRCSMRLPTRRTTETIWLPDSMSSWTWWAQPWFIPECQSKTCWSWWTN